MARAGLGSKWQCTFANDFDFKKSAVYKAHWGSSELVTKDVGTITPSELPGCPDLIWASFPCQDLSLAGMGAGLRGDRSGTFWPFWRLVSGLAAEQRGPRVLVLENVCGTLTSHDGKDFTAIADALSAAGYLFGALIVDAALFVPQSRPRLFIIAVAAGTEIPPALVASTPSARWHSKALRTAYERLTRKTQRQWIWWNLPTPAKRTIRLDDLIEENPTSVAWHTAEETAKLLGMMSAVNFAKVKEAKKTGKRLVGTVYKRTRFDENDMKVQRAEIRFDGIAGCLRTSSGGSSRQLIVVVTGKEVRSRLLSSRETARLMGLPDEYALPKSYNEAYHLTGDGVVVPVVRHLAEHILEPLAASLEIAHERVA
ncbi:MAG TPA: DNA (cytosine-5-)-methyltransferase [Nitrospira sp.]|nr:DNA (cytosine-5-)-methyltransferase [Nitrospira sp.]